MPSFPQSSRSVKPILYSSTGLIIALSGVTIFGYVHVNNATYNPKLDSNTSSIPQNCDFVKSDLSTRSLTLPSSESLTQSTALFQPGSLLPSHCLKAVVTVDQQQIVISPESFPDLWQASQDMANAPSKPYPTIHDSARAAKVPILMYHDILPRKEVFFDVTPEELEAHFKYIQEQGLTPISPDLLLAHLQKGIPLPDKPVLLTFDDGYGGHYEYVYPLLKKYGYPAVFSIYLKKMEGKTARSSLTWPQLKEMAADPLVTIASHTISHPKDLRELSDDELFQEILISKQLLEKELGIPITYFTYPEGKYDARVKQWAMAAGYSMAFTMDDQQEIFAGQSPDLLSVGRFGQSQIQVVVPQAWGGYPAPTSAGKFNFSMGVEKREHTIDDVTIMVINGGKPSTIHADSRYQVPEIMTGTDAIAAVDGAFFSLKYLDSNVMIGPVMSQGKEFVPGNASENPRLNGRPLVLITDKWVKFIPFDANIHNTLEGIQAESYDGELIKDLFVGAAWLVKNSQAQPAENFGNLFDFDVARHRAFWGIHQSGQPMIGVTKDMVDSIKLGKILQKLGFRDAIMLDSGASTSLAFEGKSVVEYTPRPVPHIVILSPPLSTILETKEAQ
ncbi:polysaccharide deacetylase family protein [Aphanothece sacrum]|uniref:Polysaccharide deacetylase n=1 Tax=Aphanothece sacrum FPU1 TaxID=1920663 RepID=A0A401II40_APHSA|nr:polysaccharide deacetylase family protein [Aphanothece sacrum]GBF80856.1 polysaccharide deacetylase [Aphanothece sacrum FPU1]GBF85642.1 polysaccharide deacetylase [Aphanothece sacrum FPU3]